MTPGGAHRWPVSLQHGPVGLRPLRARDENFWYEVRARNASWTRPWDATRPDEATDAGLTFRQLVRQFNADARAGRALPWAITWTEPGEPPVLVGQLTISGITYGSARWGMAGYWVDRAFAGRGIVPTALAMGATGVIAWPMSTVWVIIWSRTGTPCSAFMTARAREFSSATLTPCGHTTLQVPQLEQ